ncbi:acyltransferase family protein [Paenibacillus sp. Marseille-Q4541]|uniref:acyltransferase family protein n=1 Tax=Paenibacillus sp. Marseille-Q4541 TaxID=2831522 RepID=UPI001BAB68F3|nr:acyltransferase family protein [Paenibacillus sp. Marseille-Q4541]
MNNIKNVTEKRYMPGLDGLRAISVLAVMAYHLNVEWASGGLLGVAIFFVLSGYLITDQILLQWKKDGRLHLTNFWIRRAKRLIPSMFVMLIFVAVWLLISDPSRLSALKGDFASAAFYVNNWYLIFHDISYFESFGPQSPIGHLWSLAIEEQFYMLWPLLLFGLLHVTRQRGKLFLIIMTGSIVSALAMMILYTPGTDPSRVYYGTDTRAFGLLIGAALAVIWPSVPARSRVFGTHSNWMDMTGVLLLAILLCMIVYTDEYGSFLYEGGLFLVSILTALLIAILAHPHSRIAKMMGLRPLRWIGVRSYSLYVWHYPIMVLTSSNVNTDQGSMVRIILQILASFLFAAVSYTYIEEPIRRGTFRNIWKRGSLKRALTYRPFLLIVASPLLLVPVSCSVHKLTEADLNDAIEQRNPPVVTTETPEESNVPSITEQPIIHDEPANSESLDNQDASSAETQLQGDEITLIGDSVILDASPFLKKSVPGIVIDGKVGRQMSAATDVVNELRAKGRLGNDVVIELGTNGAFTEKQLAELLDSLDDVEHIVLVNTRVPRKWQNRVNTILSEAAEKNEKVTLLDWYAASEGKPFFYDDGVHLKREGAEYYASLLIKTLQELHK